MIRVGLDTPYVTVEGNGHLPAHQLSVLRAMREAVALAAPGEVIVQEDMVLVDPLPDPLPLYPGAVTVLDEPVSSEHFCPRAFVLPDLATKAWLLRLWSDETMRACHGWAEIPKVRGPVSFYHPPRPPRRVRDALA